MSFMRSLGEIVGLILKPVGTPARKHPEAAPEPRRVTREHVEESTRDTQSGVVRLRRTTIEEIEYVPRDTGSDADPDR
jgi:hypothetical protein